MYRVISSDNHIMEPGDLWTGRVEPKFKGREPHVIRRDDGSDWWVCDGNLLVGAFAGSQTGLRFEEPEKLSVLDTVENIRPGGYIPEEHVKDMELDGVDVSIVFPTVGLLLYGVPDSALLTSLFRTYNDWVADFCSQSPDILKGIAMINVDDVTDGVKELERCAKMGMAGAMITVYPPETMSYDYPEYDPLWAAAQDLQMPLNLHIGTNRPHGGQEFVDFESASRTFFTNVDHWIRMSLGYMIFSGVFERFPKLQVGSVEMELSWAPHFLDRLDYNYTQRPPRDRSPRDNWGQFKSDMVPSDYFHRNVFLGFQEDMLGVQMRKIIGVDNLLWGSDYPHQESTFPRSHQILEEILSDCTEEETTKIAGGNAARIYNFN